MTAAVEWGKLLEVVWASLAAGIGATVLYSFVVFSSSRAAEARREGSSATVFGLLATVALGAFLGLVVLAFVVILEK